MMYALREERGQMAVELAALMPVILVSLVILWNLARYVSACVLFDRVAPDAVLAEAAAAGAEDGSVEAVSAAETSIRKAFEDADDIEISVEAEAAESAPLALRGEPHLMHFRCTLSYHPWPRHFVVAGIDSEVHFELVHVREVVADAGQAGRTV